MLTKINFDSSYRFKKKEQKIINVYSEQYYNQEQT